MSKIYRRSKLLSNAKGKVTEKNRRRNIIINFRVSEEEKEFIDNRILLSGLSKSDYFIQSCMYQKIHVTGNVRTFDEMKRTMKKIDNQICHMQVVDELDEKCLESLKMILLLLDGIYGINEEKQKEEIEN
ncbi:MAG: hypothetical protein R3Y24_11830 [Eubacteriales bacterium]